MLIFCSAFLSYSPTGTSFPRGGLGEAGVFENSADAQQQDTFQGGRVCRGFGGGSFFSCGDVVVVLNVLRTGKKWKGRTYGWRKDVYEGGVVVRYLIE